MGSRGNFLFRAAKAAALAGKAHDMAFDARLQAGRKEREVARVDGLEEVAYEREIAARVAAVLVGLRFRRDERPRIGLPRVEAMERKGLAVALDVPERPHDARAPPAPWRERVHREARRHPTLEKKRGDDVVWLVVVHAVDAAPVVGRPQLLEDRL